MGHDIGNVECFEPVWGGFTFKMDIQEVGCRGTYDCVNKLSDSRHCGEFLDKEKTCLVLKKDSAPWSKLQRVTISGATQISVKCVLGS